jgi:tRNA threonylcarbamoyladenosine biosynthesis protein TsaB
VLVLGFDTATPRVSVAIGDDGHLLGEVRLEGGTRHAEQLAPAIRYLCDEVGVRLDRLAAIGVGVGPGLFTGLRVGVTTAKVMAQALRVPLVGVPSLDLVAYPLRHAARPVVVALDARRKEVFDATYRPVPGGMQRVDQYRVRPPAELAAELEASGDEVLLAGDGARRYREELAALEHVELVDECHDSPSAAALVALAAAKAQREEYSLPWDVGPLYLRRSDAEIEWERTGR